MTNPLVSICIPVWNRPEMLRAAMLSAMAQTYAPLEIIVCDNDSSDNTASVARELAAKDPRVHVYVNDSNVGGFNYTMTLRASRGELVQFLNSDDMLAPHCVERMVQEMKRPEVALAFCRARFIDREGHEVPPSRHENLLGLCEDTVFGGRELGDQILARNANLIGCPTQVMWRRSALGEGSMGFGGRGWHVVGDIAHWLALLARGDAAYVDEPLCTLMCHPGQEREAVGARVRIAFDCLELAEIASRHGFLRDQRDRCSASTIALRQLAWRFSPEIPEAKALLQAVRVATERLRVHRGGPPGIVPRHGITTFLFVVNEDEFSGSSVVEKWLHAAGDRMDVRLVLATPPELVETTTKSLLPLRADPGTALSLSGIEVIPITGTTFVPGPVVLVSAEATSEDIAAAISEGLTPSDGAIWASPNPQGLPEADRVRSMKWWASEIGFDFNSPLSELLFKPSPQLHVNESQLLQ